LQARSVGAAAGKELLQYFGDRLVNLFFSFDWETESGRLVKSLQEPQDDEATVIFPPIRTDPEIHAAGQRLMGELWKYFEESPPSSQIHGFRWLHYVTLAQRHLMRIASFRVELEPTVKGTIAVKSQGHTLFSQRPIKNWKPVRTSASLDLYISVSNMYRAATVSVKGRVVAVKFQGNVSRAWRDQFQAYVADRDHADGLLEAFRLGLDAFIDTSGFRSRFEKLRADFTKVVDLLYVRPSLSWVREEEVENCRTKLKARGLLGIVDGNVALLQSLAGLTLCASFLATEREAALLLPNMEIPVPQAMDAIGECTERHGMPLIFGRGNKPLNGYV